ncbi:MAG: hypothetical protein IRY86_03570 [Thermorudis peleae]|nr:hypothetical protein [Thermorudis peleae]
MQRQTKRLSRVLFLFSLLLTAPIWTLHVSAATLPYRIEPSLTSSVGQQIRGLAMSSTLLVWEDWRSGTPDIYAYDLTDNREFRPDPTPGYRTAPAVSGSRIVWVSGKESTQRQIVGIDLGQGQRLTITSAPAEVDQPAIDGDIVVWRQRINGTWQIFARRLSDNQPMQLSSSDQNHGYPTISGTRIVWQEYQQDHWKLVLYDLSTRTQTFLTQGSLDEEYPHLAGDWLIFLRWQPQTSTPQLVLRNIQSHEERVLSQDHFIGVATTDGKRVVWEDWRSGLAGIYAYDIEAKQEFAIARSQDVTTPAVNPTTIAWIAGLPTGQSRVQAVALIQRLPTDPQDPPAVPSPDRVYFPQTQHYVSAGFKAFWQAHGAEQIFGYPLSEEFTITDPATGEKVTVQYFERARLEYRADRPENERITIGRLGVELTQDRAFQPIAPFQSTSDRLYFPETGHSLAYGFKTFWETHGGLAIFGYPISEEFTENGHTVQYFERARFEYHPEASDPNARITLGLLGREMLERMGWLPRPPLDTTMLMP